MIDIETPALAQGDGSVPEWLERIAAPASSDLPFPRLLVVLAHPDDEVLALGARLERLREARLLTITDGAPRNGADALQHGFDSLAAYRAARRAELLAGLEDAGLSPEIVPAFPGSVADQEASFHLAALARAVAREIQAFEPEAVLTHPYEGGHPDHDACAFAVHTAVTLLLTQGALRRDLPVVEAPFYHADGSGGMATGSFLQTAQTTCIVKCLLGPAEQAAKRQRLACFHSQAETLAQFGVERETFRVAPAYDFSKRPHAGQLFYERFSWGMDGDRFVALVAKARVELFEGSIRESRANTRDRAVAG